LIISRKEIQLGLLNVFRIELNFLTLFNVGSSLSYPIRKPTVHRPGDISQGVYLETRGKSGA
jgi:hypothetical protein